MSKFVYVFRGGGIVTQGLSPTQMQEHLARWHAWLAPFVAAGRHQGGQALLSEGTVLRGHDRVVTDGPFAEGKDIVTGTLIIEAASLAEATALAQECPVFEFGGSVEVRPVREAV